MKEVLARFEFLVRFEIQMDDEDESDQQILKEINTENRDEDLIKLLFKHIGRYSDTANVLEVREK